MGTVMIKRIAEVLFLGLLLLGVTAPSAPWLLAQSTAIIKGERAVGSYENIKSDGSGRLLVNTTGLSGVTATGGALPVTISNVTATYTFSSVAVTAATKQITGVSTSRKALLVQNNSTLYNMYIGNASPVTATSGFTLVPGASFFATQAVPSSAWYVLGTSSVTGTVQIGEAQ